MNILIAYASKSGTCRTAAKDLAQALPSFEVTLADLGGSCPNPAEYDYVVLGGAVRFRKLHRAVREYAKKYRDLLKNIPHTLFICCAYAEFAQTYADWGFSKELTASAEEVLYFGGELNVGAQKGIERWIVRRMRNEVMESEEGDAVLPGYLPEHVRLLADRLRKQPEKK